MNKPDFQKLWDNFPTHSEYPTMGDLYRALGGNAKANIDVPGFGENGNACASRLSVAFNLAGAPITREKLNKLKPALNLRSLGTAKTGLVKNGYRIIYAVEELRQYIKHTLGPPTIVNNTRPYNKDLMGKQGIIAFRINFSDATGHITLWDGRDYREPEYDDHPNNRPELRIEYSEFWMLE